MKKTYQALFVSMIIVAMSIGVSIGYFFTPEYQQTMYSKNSMDLGQADGFLDQRYLSAMIAHHRGAILLAQQIEKKTSRTELRELALEIQTNEPKLIAELYQWKKEWYRDIRIVRDPVVAQLGNADSAVDLRFLNALIAHHEAGIRMTEEVRTKSSRSEVIENADAVEKFLRESLVILKQKRADWYNV